MNTEQWMTRNVRTCSPDDTLEQAVRIMWEADVGSVIVTDQAQRPIGIITDRDVAIAAYTQGVALRDARVQSAMASQVVTCAVTSTLGEIEDKMQRAQVRRIPVIDSEGKLIGVVSLADIARAARASTFGLAEVPGLAKTLIGITARREAAAAE
jgi:CBS domain-containing protein